MKKSIDSRIDSIKKKSKTAKKSEKAHCNDNSLKKLSFSFYNLETLSGNKKIMLDEFPIENVQTEGYLSLLAPKESRLKKVKKETIVKQNKTSNSNKNSSAKIQAQGYLFSKKNSKPSLNKRNSEKIFESIKTDSHSYNKKQGQSKKKLIIKNNQSAKNNQSTNSSKTQQNFYKRTGKANEQYTQSSEGKVKKYFDHYLKKLMIPKR